MRFEALLMLYFKLCKNCVALSILLEIFHTRTLGDKRSKERYNVTVTWGKRLGQRWRCEIKPGQENFVEGQKRFQQDAQMLGVLYLWVILSHLQQAFYFSVIRYLFYIHMSTFMEGTTKLPCTCMKPPYAYTCFISNALKPTSLLEKP